MLQGDWAVPMVFCASLVRVFRLLRGVLSAISYSFTYLAYSSSGTFNVSPSQFVMVIVSPTCAPVLLYCGLLKRQQVRPVLHPFLRRLNLCGNSERMRTIYFSIILIGCSGQTLLLRQACDEYQTPRKS